MLELQTMLFIDPDKYMERQKIMRIILRKMMI